MGAYERAKLTSLQAETATQLNTLSTNKVSRTESAVITNDMLSQEVKTSMTGGSVAIVGASAVEIRNLTTEMAKILGVYADVLLTCITGQYFNLNGNPKYPSPNVSNQSAVVTCVAGDRFKYTNRATIYFSGYVFTDGNNAVISSRAISTGTVNVVNEEITAPFGATKLYINSTIDVKPILNKLVPYNIQSAIQAINTTLGTASDYAVIKDNVINLFTSFTSFSLATVTGMVATITGVNGGMMTNVITSTGNNVVVKLQGSFTIPTCAIQLKITRADLSTTYVTLKGIPYTDGVIDTEVTFDPTYYAVYENAISYNILLNSIGSSNIGTISLTSIAINDRTPMQRSPYYDVDFPTMLDKVFSGIDTAKQLPITTVTEVFMKNGNGSNYKTQVSLSGALQVIPCVPSLVLVIGNSLLLGMNNEFGMCASSVTQDFYHYVKSAIVAKNAICTFSKVHCAPLEQAETDASADNYYTNYAGTYSVDLDLIVIQIGDNVNNANRVITFTKNFPLFLQKMRTRYTKARIVVVGVWFNISVFDILQSACNAYGCELVNIRDLNITANQGYSGQTYVLADAITRTVDDTWITHPGNLGHQIIGDRIIAKLKM